MKTSKKTDSWSYPSLADSWREDFVKLIPHSKRRKELIKYVKLIDWERIGHLLSLEAKAVMKKIGVPESYDSLKLNSSIVEAIILANIKERLHYLLFHYLSSINKTDTIQVKNRKLKGLLDRVEFEIIRNRSVFNMILDVGSLKWIKDSDTKQSILDALKKKFSKSYGKKYNDDNLKYYREIYTKNDEYIERDGEGNYRRAARNVIKTSDSSFENIYKSFNNFKNKNNILTLDEFKKFLSTIDRS